MTNAEAIRIINQYDCNFYWTDGERIPTDDLIEAFELAVKALDAQEPRVLTRDEIVEAGENGVVTCYIEVKGDRQLYGGCFEKYDEEHTAIMCDVSEMIEKLSSGTARLWTSRPTDEQREAEPWQE